MVIKVRPLLVVRGAGGRGGHQGAPAARARQSPCEALLGAASAALLRAPCVACAAPVRLCGALSAAAQHAATAAWRARAQHINAMASMMTSMMSHR